MSRPGPLTTWCRLLRLPNLFTVPGDPLAGFMLATGGVLDWRVAGAMATSLLLYSAGLLLNDYFDRDIDARERPERPIPSGAVKAGTVLAVGLMLPIAGVGVAFAVGHAGAGAVAMALALAVFVYDAGLKRIGWLGPLIMGSCRAGSVVLGAAFAMAPMAPSVVAVAGITSAYIAIVSLLAAQEASGERPGLVAYAPLLVPFGAILLMVGVSVRRAPIEHVLAIFALSLGGNQAARAAVRMRKGQRPVPAFIGALLRATILFQTGWALWSCSPSCEQAWALLLCGVALFGCAELAARRFYGS